MKEWVDLCSNPSHSRWMHHISLLNEEEMRPGDEDLLVELISLLEGKAGFLRVNYINKNHTILLHEDCEILKPAWEIMKTLRGHGTHPGPINISA